MEALYGWLESPKVVLGRVFIPPPVGVLHSTGKLHDNSLGDSRATNSC